MPRLVQVRPGVDPGFRRVRTGTTFRYLDAHGIAAPDAARRRIIDLVIPPAWVDVWIAIDEFAHIQAVGTDDAGRRQYLYHARWRVRRDRGKFGRALALAEALPRARSRVTTVLRHNDLDRALALAVSFRLLDEAAPRIGSARYLERHGSRGLTTLQRRHASIAASAVTLSFRSKSGGRAVLEIDDPDLAVVLERLKAGKASSSLLWYPRGRRQVPLTPADVNSYVRELTGGRFSAKDFRTLRGTIAAADALARIGSLNTTRERKRAEALATQAAASILGNTPSVARGSYIDPRVFQQYARGHLLDLALSPETAIQRLLGRTTS